jgi:type I restriction enzyme M protein
VDALPQIPRRSGAGKGSRRRANGQALFVHHRYTAPLVELGRAKEADGLFDHDRALTGGDLIAYINNDLFPYLKSFKERASGPDTIEYKIGEIFGEIRNRFESGYNLRDALELLDGLRFRSQKEKHELSHLYEAKIKNMGNAGRNGGEYYTPRPLIRAMIAVTKRNIGERIYDGALRSAGFLCEAYEHLRKGAQTTTELQTLQTKTFYGKEKKPLAYVIAIMNMILHGIEAPNVIHANALGENVSDIQEKDLFEVIFANPPFGGHERRVGLGGLQTLRLGRRRKGARFSTMLPCCVPSLWRSFCTPRSMARLTTQQAWRGA